jgi:hypothetical protein
MERGGRAVQPADPQPSGPDKRHAARGKQAPSPAGAHGACQELRGTGCSLKVLRPSRLDGGGFWREGKEKKGVGAVDPVWVFFRATA